MSISKAVEADIDVNRARACLNFAFPVSYQTRTVLATKFKLVNFILIKINSIVNQNNFKKLKNCIF